MAGGASADSMEGQDSLRREPDACAEPDEATGDASVQSESTWQPLVSNRGSCRCTDVAGDALYRLARLCSRYAERVASTASTGQHFHKNGSFRESP